ncbi:MAG TPA: hypothetical protein VH439_17460 [Gemmatimonadales bacterium]|jgi:hypothetical protein
MHWIERHQRFAEEHGEAVGRWISEVALFVAFLAQFLGAWQQATIDRQRSELQALQGDLQRAREEFQDTMTDSLAQLTR